MTRIRARTIDDFQFRPNDNVPTRVQKLELLRNFVGSLTDHLEEADTTIVEVQEIIDALDDDFYYRFGAFWIAAPLTKETMLLHPVTDNLTFLAQFEGSVGYLGGTVGADMVFTIYRNPVMTGEEITGGTVLGTFTISSVDQSYTYETTDDDAWYLYAGETLGVKAQTAVEAAAFGGSFTLIAFLGLLADYLAIEGGASDGAAIQLEGPQYEDGRHVLATEGV